VSLLVDEHVVDAHVDDHEVVAATAWSCWCARSGCARR
jgi:hypothetical protein